jgi:hypothetical protein
VAVSKTADATGGYILYDFGFSEFIDYPKLGIWPDAYYMSFNLFTANGKSFLGPLPCALQRSRMLVGRRAGSVCFFGLSNKFFALLPSDLDGSKPPAPGRPNVYVNINFATQSLNLWRFHVDFAGTSTFTGPTKIKVAPFTPACNGGVCIPQPGTSQQLDSLADRLMYRLAYRNFGTHESLVVNHSVRASRNNAGVRWYEVRNPFRTPVLFQQGTFAPDVNSRWMGSIAMDKVGNAALGYSVSSSSVHPSIRYTGRVPTDSLGTMETENSIFVGTGSQRPRPGNPNVNRWGDYTSMAIDPVDDCTFWYANEYLRVNGAFNWDTRLASFRFPSCH